MKKLFIERVKAFEKDPVTGITRGSAGEVKENLKDSKVTGDHLFPYF